MTLKGVKDLPTKAQALFFACLEKFSLGLKLTDKALCAKVGASQQYLCMLKADPRWARVWGDVVSNKPILIVGKIEDITQVDSTCKVFIIPENKLAGLSEFEQPSLYLRSLILSLSNSSGSDESFSKFIQGISTKNTYFTLGCDSNDPFFRYGSIAVVAMINKISKRLYEESVVFYASGDCIDC